MDNVSQQMDHLTIDEVPSVGYITQEVTCQRSVAGTQFAAGVQDFSFSISQPNVWLPGSSYLVAEVEILGGGDPATAVQPTISEMLALSENAVAMAYSSAYQYVGGATLDSVNQDHAQIAAVHARINDTWAQSRSLGDSAMLNAASFAQRLAKTSSTSCYPVSQADRGTSGLIGISLDGKETIIKPCAAGQFSAATLSVASLSAIAVGVNTLFTSEHRGALLYIQGVCMGTISGVTSALQVTFSPNTLTNPAAIAATPNWYLVIRNQQRTVQAKNKIQILYRPPLGVYNTDTYLPPGQYRLSLGPNPNYRFACVETLNETAVTLPSTGATCPYTINVLDVRMYVASAQKQIVDGVQPHLHLMEYQSFSRTMNSTSASFNFTVPASTEELYVGLQHPSAGSNPVWSPARFVGANNSDLNIIGIQVSYAGLTKPPTRTSSGYANEDPAGRSKAYLTGLYYQSLLELGSSTNPGGEEDIDSWMQRGPLFAFKFNKDARDRSTEVSVQLTYGAGPLGAFATDSKVFLIARYRAKRQLTVQNGQVTQVVAIDA
jgi:hypothetical protein